MRTASTNDLPLFAAAGIEVVEPAARRPVAPTREERPVPGPRARKRPASKAAKDTLELLPVAAPVSPSTSVIPFPLHRDLRFVRRMLNQAKALVGQMGREQAKVTFAARYEKRMEARLRGFGLSTEEAREEIARVLRAMNVLALQERARQQVGGSAA